jgi:hypothetical protein
MSDQIVNCVAEINLKIFKFLNILFLIFRSISNHYAEVTEKTYINYTQHD